MIIIIMFGAAIAMFASIMFIERRVPPANLSHALWTALCRLNPRNDPQLQPPLWNAPGNDHDPQTNLLGF